MQSEKTESKRKNKDSDEDVNGDKSTIPHKKKKGK